MVWNEGGGVVSNHGGEEGQYVMMKGEGGGRK